MYLKIFFEKGAPRLPQTHKWIIVPKIIKNPFSSYTTGELARKTHSIPPSFTTIPWAFCVVATDPNMCCPKRGGGRAWRGNSGNGSLREKVMPQN